MKNTMYLAIALAAAWAATPAQASDNVDVDGRVYYLRSNVIPPWDVTSNEVDMNEVFGWPRVVWHDDRGYIPEPLAPVAQSAN